MSNYYYAYGTGNQKNKFHAEKIKEDGEEFDSKAEYKRWRELKIMERAKVITELSHHTRYELIPKQTRPDGETELPCVYEADFSYYNSNHELVVEDVKGCTKGTAYELYVIKRKLMLKIYGIAISEINRKKKRKK